ncbi:hypothetical protein ANO11243_067780 [Dothideomycetidae sp. 11243]|nr:hypothetical protein ANO11243_067780 [fungal sp. No.11243]
MVLAFVFPQGDLEVERFSGEASASESSATAEERAHVVLPALKTLWESSTITACLLSPEVSVPSAALASCRYEVAEACLNACTMIDRSAALVVTDFVRKLLAGNAPVYLKFQWLLQNGKIDANRDAHDALEDVWTTGIEYDKTGQDVRTTWFHRLHLLSKAERALCRADFGATANLILQCKVRSAALPPPMVLGITFLSNSVQGKLSRYTGNFQNAFNCFDACTKSCESHPDRFHILHHLCNVMCELALENQVEGLILGHIESMRAAGETHSQDYRLLLSSLAEAYLKQKRVAGAQNALSELQRCYESVETPDIADQLGHIQTLVGLVRVCIGQKLWLTAHGHVETAYHTAHGYDALVDRGFVVGVILKYRALICCMSASDAAGGSLALEQASREHDAGPSYFIVGLGTYVLSELTQTLQDCGCVMTDNTGTRKMASVSIPAGEG